MSLKFIVMWSVFKLSFSISALHGFLSFSSFLQSVVRILVEHIWFIFWSFSDMTRFFKNSKLSFSSFHLWLRIRDVNRILWNLFGSCSLIVELEVERSLLSKFRKISFVSVISVGDDTLHRSRVVWLVVFKVLIYFWSKLILIH